MPKTYRMDKADKRGKGKGPDFEMSEKDMEDDEEVKAILEAAERYRHDRLAKEEEWTESYACYMSWAERGANPFVANLFIPKVHEAVEMVTAFLLGPNQSVTVRPEEGFMNWAKAKVAEKWLDFLWRKRLDARQKFLTWVKQGVVFGNGVVKVGWDDRRKVPEINNTAIEDVLFDFYEPDIQKSEYLIHVVRRTPAEIRKDDRYDEKDSEGNYVRETCVANSDIPEGPLPFYQYDRSPAPEDDGKATIYEAWTLNHEMLTIAPTSMGWRVLRRKKNNFRWRSNTGKGEPFRPFVKLRFKVSPLPNRAYDMGGVYPTVHLQKAFNDLFNQYLTNIVLTNNAMWIKRKGASISSRDLVRRPGGVITVTDIDKDLKPAETPGVKPEVISMLERLDAEFQQASMIVSLMKGIGSAELATEMVMGQENFYTLLRPLQDNISEAFSELGAMVLQVTLDHHEGETTLELFESDNEIGILTFDPQSISADYDVRIVPDRSAYLSKVVRQKQLIEFLNIVRGDPNVLQRYPDLPDRLYRKWLDEAGFSDLDTIFAPQGQMAAVGIQTQPLKGGPAPSPSNPETLTRSITSPSIVGQAAKIS